MERVRVDKWLWAARFFKTRSQATRAVDAGHVRVDDERVKPARDIAIGSRIEVRNESGTFVVAVKALSDKRGNAASAQALYEESADSIAARQAQREARTRFADPAARIFARPTKKNRRDLDRFRDA